MSYNQDDDFQPRRQRRQKRSRGEDEDEEDQRVEERERPEDFSHKPRRLLEEDSSPVYSEDNLAKIEDDRPLIKHSGLRTHNLFLMSESDRKSFLSSHPNPYNYPKLYKSIYDRERRLRKPVGYQNCQNITDRKLFIPNGQLSKKLIISNRTNTNCIMSKDTKGLEHTFLSYSYETIPNEYMNENDMGKYFVNCNYGMIDVISDNESIERWDRGISYAIHESEHRKYVLKTIEEIKYNLNKFGKTPKFVNFSSRAIVDILIEINKEVVDQNLKLMVEKTIDLMNQSIEMRNSKALYHIKPYLDDFYKFGIINFCEPLEFFFLNIYDYFGPYANNIVIAGGAALSYYIMKNYGYETYFSDIDVFIHGMEGREQEIIDYIYSKGKGEYFYSDGAFINSVNEIGLCKTVRNRYDDFSDPYPNYKYDCLCKHVKFMHQIILRSYCSPSEVIHGFDVDSSCVLVNKDLEIYGTERFMYAISKGYNTINFDRMSPSYIYRIFKFFERGFAIWIPEIEYVKNNTIFNPRFLEKRNLGLLFRKLIGISNNYNKIFQSQEISDYTKLNRTMTRYRPGHVLNFITIDPGQQISSTNNKEVLEDPIVWYTKFDLKGNHLLAYSRDIDIHDPTMVEIVDPVNTERQGFVCENVIVSSVRYKENFLIKQSSDKILRDLNMKSGSRLIYGNLAFKATSGNHYDSKLSSKPFDRQNFIALIKEINFDDESAYYQYARDIAISYLHQTKIRHLLELLIYNMNFVHTNDEMSMQLYDLIINDQINISELLNYHCLIFRVGFNNYHFRDGYDILYGEEEIIDFIVDKIIKDIKEGQQISNFLDAIGLRNIEVKLSFETKCFTKYHVSVINFYTDTMFLNAVNPFVQRLILENERCIEFKNDGFLQVDGDKFLLTRNYILWKRYVKYQDSFVEGTRINFVDQNIDEFISMVNSTNIEDLFFKPGEIVTIVNNLNTYSNIQSQVRSDFMSIYFVGPVDDLKSLTENIIETRLDDRHDRNNHYYYVNGHYFTSRAKYISDSLMSKNINSIQVLPYPAWQKFIRSEDTPVYTVKYHF